MAYIPTRVNHPSFSSLMQWTCCLLNFASPQHKLRDVTICSSTHHSSVLRLKPVKPMTDGFEAETTNPSIPSFQDQSRKPSCMPCQAWLNDVDTCLTSKCSRCHAGLVQPRPWLRQTPSSSRMYSCSSCSNVSCTRSLLRPLVHQSKPSCPPLLLSVHRARTFAPNLLYCCWLSWRTQHLYTHKPRDMLHNAHDNSN